MSDTTEVAVENTPTTTGTGSTELKYPKVIARGEDASIVHYAPQSHDVPDPSTRN